MSTNMNEKQKHHLHVLLKIKRSNPGINIAGLNEEIENAVVVINSEDVAWVEKIAGIRAME